MAYTVFDGVAKFSADTSQLDQFIVKLEQGLSSASEKAAASTRELKSAQEEFRASIKAVTAQSGDTTENLQRLAESEKNLALAAAAAKQEHGALKNSLLGARDAADKTGYSFREARGSMMLVEETLGVHLPREMNVLLAHMPLIGGAFSAMLPIVGVVAAIAIIGKLVQAHSKLKEEQEKIKESQQQFGTAVQNSFNGLDDKLLQAGIKMDELRGDHVDALKKEIELIDHISLKELESQFNLLAKAADAMFAQLTASWYEIGSGSLGAKHALDEFKAQYDLLLAQGKDKEASDLLSGTLRSAKETLATMQAAKKAAEEASTAEEQGAGPSAKELLAQQTLIDGLNAQVTAQTKINELAKDNISIKRSEEGNRAAGQQATAAKEALDKQLADIKKSAEDQHSLFEAHKIDLAQWLAAELHATDAAAIAHEDYQRKLVAIYTQAGEADKARAAQAALDVLVENDKTEAQKKLNDAMDAYRKKIQGVRDEYAHLVNAGVVKEWEKQTEAAKKLTAAEEEMVKVQTKLSEDTLSAHYQDQETAITKLAQMHLITEQQKDDRLKLLEEEQSKKAIAIIDHEISEIEKKQAEAQSKLSAAKASPTATGSQITELQVELDKQKTALAKAEDEKIQIQEQFNKQSEANDKSHFGRTLLMAIANGKELLAEEMKQNHAALLAEENELGLAKARGADTTAIHQKITALKQQEQALEKEASGNKAILAVDLQLTKTKLLAAQAILAEAKARGLNVTAIEKEITELKKLEAEQKREVQGTHQLQTATQTLRTTMQSSYSEMVTSVSGAMQAMMTEQKSFGAAMEEATFKMLSGMAQKWAEYFMALAIGSWPNFAAMAEYTAAAVAMEALAGALGALGSGSGGGGGGKAQMQGPSVGQTSASTGGGSASNQTTGVTHLAAGGIVSGPTMAQIGESGPEAVVPLTDPDAMARFTRLLSPSTLRAGAQASAAASTVAPQIFDEAMERIAGRNADFGRNQSPATQGGGDTYVHNHISIKGSVDHGTIAGLVKKINQGVGNRRLTLNASNSLRVTRRSQ